MSEKTTVTASSKKTSQPNRAGPPGNGAHSLPLLANRFAGFQQTSGNQAMLQLLEAGVLRAKLRVSQPGDADEIEADRVAEWIVSHRYAPVLQRKCSCNGAGTPCSKCAGEDEEKVHRSAADSTASPREASTITHAETRAERSQPQGQMIVDDEAKTISPQQQMRKSQFIAVLRAEACTAVDTVLASVGHTTKSCPYIEKWLGFYEKQNSQHIERALHKYAPETAGAKNPRDAIRLVVTRVQKAALTWAKTGKVDGLPPELAGQLAGGGGFLGAIQSFASSGVGGAILGFIGGRRNKENSDPGEVKRKPQNEATPPAHDPAGVKAQLGSGHSLDSGVQSQMSSAFGQNFSGVRVHTDSRAAGLSSDLQARAFTIGNDVAFAAGEYKPGTLIGDTLIAHELAHVVQQSGTTVGQMMNGGDYDALEVDADRSAVAAVVSGWTGAKAGLAGVAAKSWPGLKSGLRLQRCAHTAGKPLPPSPVGSHAEPPPPDRFDKCEITGKDLDDPKIRARIHALSKDQLARYKGCNHDPAVDAYIDKLLAISTPVPQEVVFQSAGGAALVVGGVSVTLLPDVHLRRAQGTSAAETNIELQTAGGTWRSRGGRITEFKPPIATATIQTRFNPGASQSDRSGYGKGTTPEDIAAGDTTLRFHEGSHGSDYLAFFHQNPFPTFNGRIGMTEREFLAAERQFATEVTNYRKRMKRFSELQTDCVGKTIEEFSREHHQRITVRCP